MQNSMVYANTMQVQGSSMQISCVFAGQQRASSHDTNSKYVLKRVFTEKGPKVRLAGLREAYFGRLLQQRSAPVLQVASGRHSYELSLKWPC